MLAQDTVPEGSEYMDEDSVLLEKVKCLATMIKKSKNF